MTPSQEKRIRTNITFVAGLGFLVKFAIFTPTLINPALTGLIALCIFGPGVISIFQTGKGDDKSDE